MAKAKERRLPTHRRSKPFWDWKDWAVSTGGLKRTGRGDQGIAEIARLLTIPAQNVGIIPSHERLSAQRVFQWRYRGIPENMIRAVAKLMGLASSEEYWLLVERGGWKPPPPKPVAKVDPITPKAKKITSRVE